MSKYYYVRFHVVITTTSIARRIKCTHTTTEEELNRLCTTHTNRHGIQKEDAIQQESTSDNIIEKEEKDNK